MLQGLPQDCCKIAPRLLEDLLGEPQGAISVYRDVLEAGHGRADALRALVRLYDGQALYPELAEVLEEREIGDGCGQIGSDGEHGSAVEL